MSLYSAMRSAVSGMSAQSSRLAAISDNISNSATVGYKRADVDFTSLVTSSGAASSYSAGGVASATRYEVSNAGTLLGTDSSTDLAIDGAGFFVVADELGAGGASSGFGLTRAGRFSTDDEGYLVNSAGLYLQAWSLNVDGTRPSVSTASFDDLVPVNVANLTYGGSATTRMSFSGNLPAQAAAGNSFSTASTLYDGLGNGLGLGLTWTKTANPNEWTVAATGVPAGYTVTGLPATVTFDATGPTAGYVSAATPFPAVTVTSPATPTSNTVALAFEGVTQLNGDYVPQFTGDGAKVGEVSTVEIDKAGTLWAIFDNGAKKALYQIPVANVVNPEGLTPDDGNVYRLGINSGALSLGAGGSGALGSVAGGALEQSNVDIADELVSLIETQRAYSSNATMVRTADEMMEETTRLKR